MSETVASALRDAGARIGSDWGRDDAELLMARALGTTRQAMLRGHMQGAVPPGFAALLARRQAGEPVAYILGDADFYGRTFAATPDVLIPRADSESVVRAALDGAPGARRVLDCGTGSGILLLTLLAELPAARGIGIDRSPGALAVARRNAVALGLGERAAMREGDWTRAGWSADLGRFDMVIANPPYVEDEAMLDASVRDYEPAEALFAGPDGLSDYRLLIPQLPGLLAPDGAAIVEIGHRQAAAVTTLAAAAGLTARVHQDLAGRDRAVEMKAIRRA
jgi:release factor glutamine methyltransferase